MTDRERLQKLVAAGRRFRMTPIVDDDFPALRDDFDTMLDIARCFLENAKPRPLIVCLCGSTRFGQAYKDALREETLKGRIVLSVGLLGHEEGIDMFGRVKKMLDELHLRKIDEADEVLILDVGGYMGESTRRELDYAKAQGKLVRFLSLEQP